MYSLFFIYPTSTDRQSQLFNLTLPQILKGDHYNSPFQRSKDWPRGSCVELLNCTGLQHQVSTTAGCKPWSAWHQVRAFPRFPGVRFTLTTITGNPLSAIYDTLTGLLLKAPPIDYVGKYNLRVQRTGEKRSSRCEMGVQSFFLGLLPPHCVHAHAHECF